MRKTNYEHALNLMTAKANNYKDMCLLKKWWNEKKNEEWNEKWKKNDDEKWMIEDEKKRKMKRQRF